MEEQALKAANEAYQLANEIKLSALAAETLMTVGRISAQLRKFELSKNSYQQALAAYESIGSKYWPDQRVPRIKLDVLLYGTT